MKTYERITLVTVATAYAGYIIREAVRDRADRLCRLAAGESNYERTHPKQRRTNRPTAPDISRNLGLEIA